MRFKYKQKFKFRNGFHKGATGTIVGEVHNDLGKHVGYTVLVDDKLKLDLTFEEIKQLTCKHKIIREKVTFLRIKPEYMVKCCKCDRVFRWEK